MSSQVISQHLQQIMGAVSAMENDHAMVRAHLASIIVNAGHKIELPMTAVKECLNNQYAIKIEYDEARNRIVMETTIEG